MLWSDFIQGLDKVRIDVRAAHGKEMNKEADLEHDHALVWLRDLLGNVKIAEKEPELVMVPPTYIRILIEETKA